MLFSILKFPARLAFYIYCRYIRISGREMLRLNGPLLIAANHPNSFLDAIILTTLFKKPVYSLARGDAFRNPLHARLLRALKILPVYRVTEGVENLEHNYTTFEQCRQIFRKGGIVLIFCEGRCINEWHLRPLMKGTARLAISSWQEGIPLRVLPAAINYSCFYTFGKNIHLHFGSCITAADVNTDNGHGRSITSFNSLLTGQLKQRVHEIDKADRPAIRQTFGLRIPLLQKILLALPAALGWLLHAPLYLPVKKFVFRKAAHNDHFDSVMTGLLFLLYPLYLLLLSTAVCLFTGSALPLLAFVLLPFCAWAYTRLKHQFIR